jgi:hypothetical protein
MIIIAIIIFVAAGYIYKIKNNRSDVSTSFKTEKANTINTESQQLLSKILATADFQNSFKDGQQKVVINVYNPTNKLFKGFVSVNIKNQIDESIGRDSIEVNLIPGGKTWAIIWAKPGGTMIDYQTSGGFTKFTGEKSSVPYDIVLEKPGNNYQTIFLTVSNISVNALTEVIKEFRSKYTKDTVLGFQLYFYTDNTTAKTGDIDKAKANYSANYYNGHSELFIYDSGETVKI